MKIANYLFVLISLGFLFTQCGEEEKSNLYVHVPPELPDSIFNKIADGDFIMRKGNGPLSFHIMNSTKEEYSHCGIIVKENNKWRVIHSIGGSVAEGSEDGVQIIDLDLFVKDAADSMLYICRPAFQDSLGIKIKQKAYEYLDTKAPFDHSFDLFDKNEIYCSELIFYILRDITGKNQMKIRKKEDAYILLYSTFFEEDKYTPIFHLKDLQKK
jgi:hypothetical protein